MFIIYNFIKLKEIVKNKVKEKRFVHILGVIEMSEKLAKIFDADTEKVKIAALLHDICKEMNIQELIKIFKENYNNEFPKEDIKNIEILHAPVGAYWVEKNLKIKDKEILDAIKYHTIGNKKMGIISKIIYIADAIEYGRNYPSVDEIREETFKNLNKGIILEVDKKNSFFKTVGKKPHKNTIDMYKQLLKEINNGEAIKNMEE